MKKLISVVLCLLMIAGIVTIGKPAAAETQGKVFNIYAWNEEFKGFFEKYYTVPEGVTVNWIINPSDGGVYQQKLDEAPGRGRLHRQVRGFRVHHGHRSDRFPERGHHV